MNSQNILKFYGSKLDFQLDYSEFYDYELAKTDLDYNSDVLDLTKPITYTTLKIDESLSNMDCQRNKITLIEYDNTINDSNYIFSGITLNLDYEDFVNHFGTTYQYTILNNDVFIFTGITNETHYFTIHKFNDSVLPLFSYYATLIDNEDNIILSENGEELILLYENDTPVGDVLGDSSDETSLIDNFGDEIIVYNVFNTSEMIVSGFSTEIISCLEKLEDMNNCCPISPKLNSKPWSYKFDTGSGVNNCENIIRRRTEKGWTLDFIFNRNNISWSQGGVFYYIGVRGEDEPENYSDNNLSFQFTSDRKIKWVAHHYSGYCGTDSYEESFYVASGETPQICSVDPTKDFNVTIVFDRYKRYEECDLENNGGWNDLIVNPTLNTPISGWLSGDTENYTYTEILNKKWSDEKQRRLGTLKIYLNGRPIYKLENWEEVIPSDRGLQPFIQSWGGGTGLMNNIHNGVCCFDIKNVKYYEEPLGFINVRHNFLTRINQYDFDICENSCVDDVFSLQ